MEITFNTSDIRMYDMRNEDGKPRDKLERKGFFRRFFSSFFFFFFLPTSFLSFFAFDRTKRHAFVRRRCGLIRSDVATRREERQRRQEKGRCARDSPRRESNRVKSRLYSSASAKIHRARRVADRRVAAEYSTGTGNIRANKGIIVDASANGRAREVTF